MVGVKVEGIGISFIAQFDTLPDKAVPVSMSKEGERVLPMVASSLLLPYSLLL